MCFEVVDRVEVVEVVDRVAALVEFVLVEFVGWVEQV